MSYNEESLFNKLKGIALTVIDDSKKGEAAKSLLKQMFNSQQDEYLERAKLRLNDQNDSTL